MVRRVVGVSSAPTPDFSPYKAVTPAAGMTDFYRQPGTMAIPESEFSQVASALQSISPTLSKVIGDQAEAANQAAADQGRIDAEKLDAEQAREAMRGNFKNLEKSGKIPVGASPFRLAAMQASLGKNVVQNLQRELNENIQKFSDPLSGLDPDAAASFVHERFGELTKGLGFYAQSAATEALDDVERGFLNRVSLMKADRTAKQNREDLANDISNVLSADKEDGQSYKDWGLGLTKKIFDLVNNHHKLTGESGREQAMKGLIAQAKRFAEDGDDFRAGALISAMEDVPLREAKPGEKADEVPTFGKEFEGRLDELRSDVENLAQAHDDKEDNRAGKRVQLLNSNSTLAAEHFYGQYSKDENTLLNADPLADREEIESYLRDTLNLSEEDASLAASMAVKKLIDQTSSSNLPDSLRYPADALAEAYTIRGNADLSAQQKLEKLAELRAQLPENIYVSLSASIIESDQEEVNQAAVSNNTVGDLNKARADLIDVISDPDISGTLSPNDNLLITRGLRDVYDLAVKEASKMTGTTVEKGTYVLNKMREYQDQVRKALTADLETELPDDIPEPVRNAVQSFRLEAAKDADPEVLKPQDIWGYDTKLDETIRELAAAKDDEAKNAIRPKFLNAAVEDARYLDDPANKDAEAFTNRSLRARSVMGFQATEITSRKTSNGVKIPDEALNPAKSILLRQSVGFPFSSISQFDSWRQTEAGQKEIKRVYDSLPVQYRVGLSVFKEQQSSMIIKYRGGE